MRKGVSPLFKKVGNHCTVLYLKLQITEHSNTVNSHSIVVLQCQFHVSGWIGWQLYAADSSATSHCNSRVSRRRDYCVCNFQIIYVAKLCRSMCADIVVQLHLCHVMLLNTTSLSTCVFYCRWPTQDHGVLKPLSSCRTTKPVRVAPQLDALLKCVTVS